MKMKGGIVIEWNGIAELIGIRLWLLSTATNLLRLSISFFTY